MEHLNPQNYMLGALLRIPFERINLHINQALSRAGFTDIRPSHQSVFQHLPHAGARITTLAESAQMTKQSMGALVDYLEERGYVERQPDPHDRRAYVVQRTARGWEVEHVARASIAQLEATWAASLGQEEYSDLCRLLQNLVTLLEDDAGSATDGDSS